MSDAQERNLIILADHYPNWVRSGFHRTRTNTLQSLEARGLAESQLASWPLLDFEYRITEAGLRLIGTMGD